MCTVHRGGSFQTRLHVRSPQSVREFRFSWLKILTKQLDYRLSRVYSVLPYGETLKEKKIFFWALLGGQRVVMWGHLEGSSRRLADQTTNEQEAFPVLSTN